MTLRGIVCAIVLGVAAGLPIPAYAAGVDYSGRIFHEGSPVVGGLVVAGTFAPSFDPHSYACIYGDMACNLDPFAYDSAVFDGNFIPIGAGDLTDGTGFFSASGTTDAAAGTPIWIFAFQDASRNSFFQALASSTNASWVVPAQPLGQTQLNASNANVFVMGDSHLQGISLTVIPFPEPNSACMALLCAVSILGRFRIRK
jgi:hypothetical protein